MKNNHNLKNLDILIPNDIKHFTDFNSKYKTPNLLRIEINEFQHLAEIKYNQLNLNLQIIKSVHKIVLKVDLQINYLNIQVDRTKFNQLIRVNQEKKKRLKLIKFEQVIIIFQTKLDSLSLQQHQKVQEKQSYNEMNKQTHQQILQNVLKNNAQLASLYIQSSKNQSKNIKQNAFQQFFTPTNQSFENKFGNKQKVEENKNQKGKEQQIYNILQLSDKNFEQNNQQQQSESAEIRQQTKKSNIRFSLQGGIKGQNNQLQKKKNAKSIDNKKQEESAIQILDLYRSYIPNQQVTPTLDEQPLIQTIQIKNKKSNNNEEFQETQKKNLKTPEKNINKSQNQQENEQINSSHLYYITKMRKYQAKQLLDEFAQLYLDHFIQSFHALRFCTNMKKVDQRVIKQKQIKFKPPKFNKTVVFDLDETLIHCNDGTEGQPDVSIPIIFPSGEMIEAGINIRPYAVYLLSELAQICEVIVFTASHSCYASKVLNYLDPNQEWISYRLYRENCIQTPEGLHIKDLRVIDRNLKDVVLIDNAAYSYSMQLSNGIPIIPYYQNKNDKELLDLLDYLKEVLQQNDVRELNKKTFKLHCYLEGKNIKECIQKICFDQ